VDRSSGTAGATIPASEIHPGIGGSLPVMITNVNGTLLFRADDGTSGNELWRSDGTGAGTTLVKDIRLGQSSSLMSDLTNVGGTLVFEADSGNGTRLWRSDG